MTSNTNTTIADTGKVPYCPTTTQQSGEFSVDEPRGHSQTGGERKSIQHSNGGSAVAFSNKNSHFEFSKLNQCIETSREFGEISVDDAETLVFFLELVRESLTTIRRYTNA